MKKDLRIIMIDPRLVNAAANAVSWGITVLQHLGDKNFAVDHLVGSDVTRRNVEKLLRVKSDKQEAVLYFGHGDRGGLYGQHNRRVLDEKNVALLAGKTVFACACHSTSLGRKAVDMGCHGFLGFRGSIWTVTKSYFASETGKAMFQAAKEIAVGRGVLAACRKAQSALTNTLSKLLLKEADPDSFSMAVCIQALKNSLEPILPEPVQTDLRRSTIYRLTFPVSVTLITPKSKIEGTVIDVSDSGASVKLESAKLLSKDIPVGGRVTIRFEDKVDAPVDIDKGDELAAIVKRAWNWPDPAIDGAEGVVLYFMEQRTGRKQSDKVGQ